jgi:hypothetical protein
VTVQFDETTRNDTLAAIDTSTGTAPALEFWSGALPANTAAADSGTKGAEGVLPSDWLAAPSGGSVSKNGAWIVTGLPAAGAGTVQAHYRVRKSGVVRAQGTVFTAVPLATSALTAAASNVLNFASTTGVVVGMRVSGAGVVEGSTVLALTGTTVTLSHASVAGVANAALIVFGGDITVDNANIAHTQVVTVTFFSIVAGGA